MWAFGSLLFFDYRETNVSPAISVLTTQNTSRPKAPMRKLFPSGSIKPLYDFYFMRAAARRL